MTRQVNKTYNSCKKVTGAPRSWSYGSWIYNYLWNQFLSPLKFWIWIPLTARCTRYNINLVTDLRKVGGFLRVILRFPPPTRLTTRYNWTILESGFKLHNPSKGGTWHFDYHTYTNVQRWVMWWKQMLLVTSSCKFCFICKRHGIHQIQGIIFISLRLNGVNPILKTNNDSHGYGGGGMVKRCS